MHNRPGSWTTWRRNPTRPLPASSSHVFTMSLRDIFGAKMAPNCYAQFTCKEFQIGVSSCAMLMPSALRPLELKLLWACIEKTNLSNWGRCFDLSISFHFACAWLLFILPFFSLAISPTAKVCSGITLNSRKLFPSSKARGTGVLRKRPLLRRNGARDFFQVPA